MIFFSAIIFFIFGTIVGSFLNVFALRYNTGLSFVSGRSKCFSCGKILKWYELIPLLSFIFLGGKCSACKSKISWQYPIVEFLTGIIFSLLFIKFGISALLPLYLLIACALVAISIYDIRHKIIPDGMVFFFDLLALVILFITHGLSGGALGTLDFLAGPILFAFFAFFWLISGGRWMGLGDAKLALGVGWLLGISGGIVAIMLAFWIGAAVSLILLAIERLNISAFGLTIKSEIPFAPFIIFGLFLELFAGWNLFMILR